MTIQLNNQEKETETDKDEIKKMLEENLELTREIHAMTHKIKGFITFQKFVSLFYILIIVVPIILSIIYLPPLLKPLFDQYSELLGGSGQPNPFGNLSPEFQKFLDQKK